ncbi:hypothetical protein K2173_017720 [Erythroxylum novogranatense]|uniref:non-specific serine/threonine protein kinase n=1 Tax=Erythroxylum novogranatense TaxID=1862640 RepID=A0AAV8SLM7_9ROSI|nr:hypothetical protein K2173_017720 [Erythroxylum novogranatense]
MPVKGAHAAPLVRVPPYNTTITIMASEDRNFLSLLVVFLVFSLHFVVSSGLTNSETLLKFKGSLSDPSALASWSEKTTPCNGDVANWVGVRCTNNSVWGLQLERMGLSGNIDVRILKDLPILRTLSFVKNTLDGPLPVFNELVALRSIYLSNNRFSGEIPGNAFEGMPRLKKLYLANNEFKGGVPSSLASLPKLVVLRLEGNQFSGQLPDFRQKFTSFNVSDNALEGRIPASLSKLNSTSFSDNKALCGEPLRECPELSGSNSKNPDSSRSKKPSTASIIVVAIVVLAAVVAIISAWVILVRRRNRAPESVEAPGPSNLQKKTGFKEVEQRSLTSPDHSGSGRRAETSKLSFVREDTEIFDLPDLLKASAEILGSGCFGSSYKAALSTGTMMVVKRFKQMNNVGREEFQEHMRRLGRLAHPNVLPLVAYYYRKNEKLLVTDHIQRGSLAVHLHGYQSLGQPSLDWPIRLKIIKGVAKGLAYLYKELPSIIAAHGHLKSSNVLLNNSYEPVLADYALVPVINQENAHELMVAYKSPEYLRHGRITKKTDVWCLGMLILEVLTGKFPENFLQQGKGKGEEDLASWVNSILPEEWTDKVFEQGIAGTKGSCGEMTKLLNIGLQCCEMDVEKRLDLKEAVERIEELKEKDNDDDFYSSYASEVDVRSSRGKSDDFDF